LEEQIAGPLPIPGRASLLRLKPATKPGSPRLCQVGARSPPHDGLPARCPSAEQRAHQALEARTVFERAALAATEAKATQVQRQYQLAVLKMLNPSQLRVYMGLYRQLAGTLLPLDGIELVSR